MLKEDYGPQLDPEGNRVVNNIMDNAKKMGQLLDDLLTFSRLGRKELIRVKIPMKDMVTNLCSETRLENPLRSIEFVVDDLPPVQGDGGVIKQVWINLISNAVKFTDAGSITCSARQEGTELLVSVKDSGIGIAPDDQPKVFEKFKQVGDTLTDKPKGTGLGLPICKEIVEYHGGRIWVESELGKGTSFFINLPRLSTARAEELQTADARSNQLAPISTATGL